MAPHDYDAEYQDDDLAFVAGGRTWHMQLVHYKVLADLDKKAAVEAKTDEEVGDRLRDRIAAYLVPEERAAWIEAVDGEQIPFAILRTIATNANGIQLGRPTTPHALSGTGRGGTGATSSGDVAAAAAARAAVARPRKSRARGRS